MNIKEIRSLIPQMTSHNTPSGLAFNDGIYDVDYHFWQSISGKTGTSGYSYYHSDRPIGMFGYDFLTHKVNIYSFSIKSSPAEATSTPKNFTFETSEDGESWIVHETFTNIPAWTANTVREFSLSTSVIARAFRINVTANNGFTHLRFLDFVLYGNLDTAINKNLILHDGEYKEWTVPPVEYAEYKTNMTSNNAPTPFVASSSSELNAIYMAWKAFNGTRINNTDAWHSASTTSAWLQIDFGSPKRVNMFNLSGRYGSNFEASPSKFEIKGSNDGIIFNTLFAENNVYWTQNEIKTFELNDIYEYRFYRLDVTNPQSGTYVIVSLLEFFFSINPQFGNWNTVGSNTPTKEQFLSEGMDSLSPLLDRKLKNLELTPMIDKTSVSLSQDDRGKVFGKTIDLKKYLDIRNMKVEVK